MAKRTGDEMSVISIGDLVSQRRSGATTYYLFDALGSTDRLLSAAQAVTDSYVYRAFGEIAASTWPAIEILIHRL